MEGSTRPADGLASGKRSPLATGDLGETEILSRGTRSPRVGRAEGGVLWRFISTLASRITVSKSMLSWDCLVARVKNEERSSAPLPGVSALGGVPDASAVLGLPAETGVPGALNR
jgi:hypothetical protein